MGALWNYITFAGSKGLVFITTVILARVLAPEDFGLMALGLLAVNYLSKLNDLGIGAALIYRQEDVEQTADTAFFLSVGMGLILSLAVFLSAPLIAGFFREPRVQPLLHILSMTFVISGLGNIHEVRLRKELDFRRRLIPQISQRFFKGAVSITLAISGFGVWSLVWGQMAGTLAAAILFWWIYPWRPSLRFDLDAARMIVSYGLQVGLFRILHVLYKNIDYLIIGRRMDALQLGFYTMAFQLPHLLIYSIQMVVGQAVFPAYAKLRNDRNALKRAFLTTFKYVSVFCVPVGLGIFFVAPEFVDVFYTEKWANTVPVMQALAICSVINSLSANADHVYKAVGRPDIANRIGLVRVVLTVPVIWIAAGYHILYVGVAQIALALLNAVLQFVVASRIISIRPSVLLMTLQPAAIASIIMLAGIFVLHLQIASFEPLPRLIILTGWGVLLYVSALWLMDKDIFHQVRAIFRKEENVL